MDPQFVKYLGFSWILDGQRKYFVFLVLPFGLGSAPRICKKVFSPLVRKWRAEQCIIVLFFDDGVFGASSLSKCKQVSKKIHDDLIKAHILPNPSKSNWEPCQNLVWLGYNWDVKNCNVSVSKKRTDKLFWKLSEFEKGLPIVTARRAASIVGSVISMMLVLGEKGLLFTRYLQNVINFRNWEEISWDSRIHIYNLDFGHKAVEEVKFLKENFNEMNIRSFETKIVNRKCLFGDAGEKAVGGFLWENRIPLPFHMKLPEELIGSSSTERELFSVLNALESFKNSIKGSKIVYITDSQSCESICRKGSSKMNLHTYAEKIQKFCLANKIDFAIAWVNRTQNQEADFMSKIVDSDGWSIKCEFFDRIKKLTSLVFTLDAFASNENRKCDRFYSRFMCPNSLGVNALLFSWQTEIVWACPPPVMATKVLWKFYNDKCKGVIVFPDWHSSCIWPVLNNDFFKNYIINSWVFPGKVCLNDSNIGLFGKNFNGNFRVLFCNFSL